MHELNFIHNVHFKDFNDAIFFSYDEPTISNFSIANNFTLFSIFEFIFNETSAKKVTYIHQNYHFSKDLTFLDGMGVHFLSISKYSDNNIKLQNSLNIFRNLGHRNVLIKDNDFTPLNLQLPKIMKNGKNACSIIVRKELTLAPFLLKKKLEKKNNAVALLIPSKNLRNYNISLTKYFIPTFLKTVSNKELKQYNITFYIGYDEGDAFFDNNEKYAKQYMRKFLHKNINIKLYKFPKTNWLNFIWNRLFIYAYLDGNNFFFQLNDDIKFLSDNWMESSIKLLGEKIGVVGFSDDLYPCRLYSIAMVNRNHFEIFDGQFYTLTFKNWCSDEWIKAVYTKYAICNVNAKIINYHPRRYHSCDRRNYLIEINLGREKLNNYIRNISKTLI